MKQNRNVVRLSESQLKAMIAESVREVLNEIGDTTKGQFALGALDGRSYQRYLNIFMTMTKQSVKIIRNYRVMLVKRLASIGNKIMKLKCLMHI